MKNFLKSLNEDDFQLAAAVQNALLTREVPRCECGKMALKNRMFADIGGDFYHFRPLGQDQVAFAIGDVMGHSMGSALLMTLILGLLGADRNDNRRPNRVVESINDMLVRLGGYVDMPITCSLIYGVVDLPSGILLYVNAGHPHPIICNRSDGKYHNLTPTTMLLGVQGGVMPESCHQFKQYDRLVLFTDGLADVHNASFEPYGEERLLHDILKTVHNTPEEAAQKIFDDVALFGSETEQKDDETLVIIDFDNTIS
jgi:serine phosphatase RsbU (regulator of sigma subunit)